MAGIACGSGAATETIPTPTPSVPPVVVVDGNGREVVFREPPRRIVALDSAVVEFLFAMGGRGPHSRDARLRLVPARGRGHTEGWQPLQHQRREDPRGGARPGIRLLRRGYSPARGAGSKGALHRNPGESGMGSWSRSTCGGRVTDNGGAAKLVAADFESRLNDVEDRLAALERGPSITTTVQGGMCGDVRSAARRLAWERLARSLLSCVSSSHRNNSSGPNRSRGSISRTTR